MIELEAYKNSLARLCTAVEDLSIENEVYFEAILESRNINIPNLKRQVAEALIDPARREAAKERYQSLWQELSRVGTEAVFADLLGRLPKSDRSN
jgi:hypothetical protein